MKNILKDKENKVFKKQYKVGNNHVMTIHISAGSNKRLKINELDLQTIVKFNYEGKDRKEPAVLKFKNTNKQGMLYSYEYEFAGRKFAEKFVKNDYAIERTLVQPIAYVDAYETVERKIPLYPSLNTIWEKELNSGSAIFKNFFYATAEFDSLLKDKSGLLVPNKNELTLLAKMFAKTLQFNKKQTINYELNSNDGIFNLYTSKTR